MTLKALSANRFDRVDVYPANDGRIRLVVSENAKGIVEKLVLTEGETLEAELELAHFGPKDFPQAKLEWKLASGDKIMTEGLLPPRDLAAGALHDLGKIRVPMTGFAMPAKLTLTVGLAGMDETNSWDIFAFPKELPAAPAANFTTIKTVEETVAVLAAGKNVLWLAPPDLVAHGVFGTQS